MADQLVILDGSTFFVSDRDGDVRGSQESGFFHADVRHLSRWELRIEGHPIKLLTSRNLKYFSARMVGTLSTARVGHNPVIVVWRDRFVVGGVHEDLILENHSEKPHKVRVEILFAADFADLFEVKERKKPPGTVSFQLADSKIVYSYERGDFHRGTEFFSTQPGHMEPGRLVFELHLEPRSTWQTCLEISPIIDGKTVRVDHQDLSVATVKPQMPKTLEEWLAQAPRLDTDWPDLARIYEQSLHDLAALRFRPRPELEWSLPAAGLPWFMALFGRDSLITAYQALPFEPHLARAALSMLAELQATESDDFQDSDPGKMPHELRRGPLTVLGEVPQRPYYGTHDTTMLFLILLDEYQRWTGDTELVKRLEPNVRAALEWMRSYGDRDGDGYLEYLCRSPKGLANQCWKDSWNSMLFADGRMAKPPIAACEIQGYAYDARMRTARLCREIYADTVLADRLEAEAADLRARFHQDFWDEEKEVYALALDRDKQRVDATTSNMGQLLWTGILDDEQAERVAKRLFASDLWSGWGIRTMSTRDSGYSPIEYHNGTVWPHDTALIAEGLRRYGLRDEATRLGTALIEAATHFAYRLPEVFAGFPRDKSVFPIEYPTASRPQAWATGAPLLVLRTYLGMDADHSAGRLSVSPHLPAQAGRLRLSGVPFRGGVVDL